MIRSDSLADMISEVVITAIAVIVASIWLVASFIIDGAGRAINKIEESWTKKEK